MAFVPSFAHRAPLRPSTAQSPRRAPRPPVVSLLKAREVTQEELEICLAANERPLVVDAYAKWCGPCQFLIPQLDLLAEKYGDKLDIVKFDTEQYPDLASALMIRGLPTLFFIKDAKLRYRMEGALTADELEKLVDYVLFDGPIPTPADDPANTS